MILSYSEPIAASVKNQKRDSANKNNKSSDSHYSPMAERHGEILVHGADSSMRPIATASLGISNDVLASPRSPYNDQIEGVSGHPGPVQLRI